MQRPRPRISTLAVLFGLLCAISLLGLTGCVVAPPGGYYGAGPVYYAPPVVVGGWYGGRGHYR